MPPRRPGSRCCARTGRNPKPTSPSVSQSGRVEVAGKKKTWAHVGAGGSHTCAGKTNGKLFCWGPDGRGELGNGPIPGLQAAPTQVAGKKKTWARVGVRGAFTCAGKTNGKLFCWGNDNFGQLGNGPTPGDQPSPVQVAGKKKSWAKIGAGAAHACARKTNRKLFCWGRDGFGQLGNGPGSANQPAPVKVVVG